MRRKEFTLAPELTTGARSASRTTGQWKALAQLIGQQRWLSEPRFASVADRLRQQDEIDRAISSWSRQYSSTDVEARLKAAGVSAERVRRINDVVDGADAPKIFAGMPERRVGSMSTTRLPFTLSFVDLPAPRSAPSLGEHSVDVLREWLNCSATEINELQRCEALK